MSSKSHRGTIIFFVNTNIIDQHGAGVKSPHSRNIENAKQVQDWKLLKTSTTAHEGLTELQFKKLSSTIVEIQIIDVNYWTKTSFRWYRPGSFQTQNSGILIIGTILHPTDTTTPFLRTRKTRWKWFRVISSWCWTSSFTICQNVFASRCQIYWQRFFISKPPRVA